ncbi:hypothetical protein HPG69_011644 [Diceros bicornis minor]|uniref:EGF-like domain-containing protein n=1 Tax=Diceros bicornis minor TaxID=77932 RepID=A0A7J7EHQ0_DICBM|nr:hypothetical protein HPG69_011644 [Diceros bicornis minor]
MVVGKAASSGAASPEERTMKETDPAQPLRLVGTVSSNTSLIKAVHKLVYFLLRLSLSSIACSLWGFVVLAFSGPGNEIANWLLVMMPLLTAGRNTAWMGVNITGIGWGPWSSTRFSALWPLKWKKTSAGESRGTLQEPGSLSNRLPESRRSFPSVLWSTVFPEYLPAGADITALEEAQSLKKRLPFLPSGINYCALNKPGCEHECVNTEEGHYCRCRRGYTLDPNGKTCSQADGEQEVFHWTKRHPGEDGSVYILPASRHEIWEAACRAVCGSHSPQLCVHCGASCAALAGQDRPHVQALALVLFSNPPFLVGIAPSGYFMFSCVTNAGVDHCAEQDHGCEQLCLNTEESFVCQCSEGFLINEDLKTCSRKRFATGVKNVLTAEDGRLRSPPSSAPGRSWGCPLGTACLPWAGDKNDGHSVPIIGSSEASLTTSPGWADYCLLSDHGCEYSCVNTDRSFACQCPEGHVLRSDGKTCASECPEVRRQAGLGPGIHGWGTVTDGTMRMRLLSGFHWAV